MKERMQLMLVALAVCFFGAGCSTTIMIKKDMVFKPSQGTIAKTIALYVPQDSKQFKRKERHSGGACTIKFGDSIVQNAERSLSMIFSKVVIVNASDSQSLAASGADYMIELKFNEDTNVDVGNFTISAHEVTVSLKCIAAESKESAIILTEDVTVKKIKRSALGFIPIVGTVGWQMALQSASDEAVQEALEKINDLILVNREKFNSVKSIQRTQPEIPADSSSIPGVTPITIDEKNVPVKPTPAPSNPWRHGRH